MKHLSKLLALLLATMLVFCASVTVFADNESSEPNDTSGTGTGGEFGGEDTLGRITVNQAERGKLYRIYRIFDLSYFKVNDSTLRVSYEMNDVWTPFFETEPGSQYLLATRPANSDLNQIFVGDEVKYINITNSNRADFAKDALEYAASLDEDYYIEKAATTTSVVFNELKLGYYLVYPVGATGIKTGQVSICNLTNTTPNATVNSKATYPNFIKSATGAVDNIKGPVQVGDNVEFILRSNVPDTTGFTQYTFRFKDKLSEGLQLNEDSFVITLGGNTLDEAYYTLSIEETDETSFTVDFDILKMIEDEVATVGNEIRVVYKAKVLASAVEKVEDNTAWLQFSNDPGDETKTEETTKRIVRVYSAKIIIDKVSAANPDYRLPGAQFVLYKNVADETAEGGVKKQYYHWNAEEEAVEWVDNYAEEDIYTTDDNGATEFIGLEEGTYYLEEIKSPAGYNLLTAPVAVEITKAILEDENENPIELAPVHVTTTVQNNTGSTLPGAGGIGTTIFYVLGSVLVLGAVVLLVTKKRMSIGK